MNAATKRLIEDTNAKLQALIAGVPTKAVFVLVFAGIATSLVFQSHAATSTVNVEPESGSRSANVTLNADTSASNGAAVKFIATGSGASCSGSAKTPGGADLSGGCYPGLNNTGVPAGTTLTTYTGSSTITSCGTVIDSKTVNSGLDIRVGNGQHVPGDGSMTFDGTVLRSAGGATVTPCVIIKNSKINGNIDTSYSGQNFGPVVIIDSELAIPTPNDNTFAGLTQSNYYGERLNIHGARTNAQCDGYCELHDSYLHDNYYLSPNHLGGFLSNGNYNQPMTLDHDTLICNLANPEAQDGAAGCSGDVNLFGDFSAISKTRVLNNLLLASQDASYCAYTGTGITKPYPDGTDIVWQNNVFQRGSNGKCASNGSVAGWSVFAGDLWSGNVWDDGSQLVL